MLTPAGLFSSENFWPTATARSGHKVESRKLEQKLSIDWESQGLMPTRAPVSFKVQ